MIFDELTAEVCEKLNLTSDEAKSRVGRELNSRYRRATSSIGLETSRRTQVSKAATVGSQTITFTGIEKVITVIDKSSGKDIILDQITPDEMHEAPLRNEPARKFAVTNTHATSVDIIVDCISVDGARSATIAAAGSGYSVNDTLTLTGGTSTSTATFKVATIGGGGAVTSVTIHEPGNYTVEPSNPVSTTSSAGIGCTLTVTFGGFTLYADGHITLATISGNSIPDFPESFHDLLVFGVMADEYRKMEKLQFSKDCENDYEKRLSDLRMWIAKSAWQDIHQGKNVEKYPWLKGLGQV